MHITAIVAAGGSGRRVGGDVPKQLLPIAGRSMLERSVDLLLSTPLIDDAVVALPAAVLASPPRGLLDRRKPVRLVAGGLRRQDSVKCAVEAATTADLVVIHDAARPFATVQLIEKTIRAAVDAGAALAALPARDTIKLAEERSGRPVVRETLPRERVWLAQTPQAFRVDLLKTAWQQAGDGDATDEAALLERAGIPVRLVDGEASNIKITSPEDLVLARALAGPGSAVVPWRVGVGYDSHRFDPARPLLLGGVHLPEGPGLAGHSDADAVCHAVTDAVLGAAGQGDIGRHFPDTDSQWKDADSLELLHRAVGKVRDAGFAVVNVDVVVIAERPRLAPHIDAICCSLAGALQVSPSVVSVKGKTNEGIGAIGQGEGLAVHAVALLAQRVE